MGTCEHPLGCLGFLQSYCVSSSLVTRGKSWSKSVKTCFVFWERNYSQLRITPEQKSPNTWGLDKSVLHSFVFYFLFKCLGDVWAPYRGFVLQGNASDFRRGRRTRFPPNPLPLPLPFNEWNMSFDLGLQAKLKRDYETQVNTRVK